MHINFDDYDDEAVKQATDAVFSANRSAMDIRTREEFARALGEQFGGDRDLYEVLGYDKTPDAWAYRNKFKRLDIAERIVSKPPKDTWRERPKIVDDEESDDDTDFEAAVDQLADEKDLWHYCRRADVVSGIGEFGLLFVGVSDGETDLSQPINAGAINGPEDIAYLTPYAQYQVKDWKLGKDVGLDETDERYTKPITYTVDITDPETEMSDIRDVHWSRVVHIAEGTVESDLVGTPRLRPVYNRLTDYQKVLGASAEMFWTGADRKFHFDVRDGYADLGPEDLEALDDDAQKLVHELQNYIKTTGVDVNVIGGEDPDPSGVIDQLLKSIAGAVGMPKRILTGSERGELASSQDKATWYGQIEERQSNFAEPQILRPLLDRLREIGALPEPTGDGYDVNWPTLFELTDLEQAKVEYTRAQALKELAPSQDPQMLMSKEQVFEYFADGAVPDPEDIEDPEPIELPEAPSPTPPGEGDEGDDAVDPDADDGPVDGDPAEPTPGDEAVDTVADQFARSMDWYADGDDD